MRQCSRAAVEAWAAVNNGVYPADPDVHQNLNGDTVIDLLPDGDYLVNPYDGYRTEPQQTSATLPGDVGYIPISSLNTRIGYTISGYGDDKIILYLHYMP